MLLRTKSIWYEWWDRKLEKLMLAAVSVSGYTSLERPLWTLRTSPWSGSTEPNAY